MAHLQTMFDIRKFTFILIFIGLSFSFAYSSKSLIHCIPCSEDFKNRYCPDYLNFDNSSEMVKLSIRKGNTTEPCIPCTGGFTEQDLSVSCTELNETETTKVKHLVQHFDSTKPNCSRSDNQIFHDGQCQTLLQQSNCPAGQWLIERNNIPTCAELPCPTTDHILFNNTCVYPIDVHKVVCNKPGQKFEIYSDGTSDCSCKDGYIKDPYTYECHTIKSQGPCEDGWVIEHLVDSSPVCIPDICNGCPTTYPGYSHYGYHSRRRHYGYHGGYGGGNHGDDYYQTVVINHGSHHHHFHYGYHGLHHADYLGTKCDNIAHRRDINRLCKNRFYFKSKVL